MGLTIIKQQGNSGRAAPGFDYYSGLVGYFNVPYPVNQDGSPWKRYSTSLYPDVIIPCKQLFSPSDAIKAGLVEFSDNTGATATVEIGTIGAIDDILQLYCDVPVIGDVDKQILIVEYKVKAVDTTKILQAAALADAINALTYSHGFSAETDGVDTVTITAPTKYGVYLNSGSPYAESAGGAFVVTITQNVDEGTVSVFAILYYHIERYFANNPKGNIWIGLQRVSDAVGVEMLVLQNASGNQVRQVGIIGFDFDL